MQIIDTKGQKCPAPLIATRRALKDPDIGDTFGVVTDSKSALDNISKFLKDNEIKFKVTELESGWMITITTT